MKRMTAMNELLLAMLLACPCLPVMAQDTAQVASTQADQETLGFGAVLDVRGPAPQGVPVLAITPGGVAERLGLRVGDRLLAINGLSLDTAAQPSTVLRQALAANNGELQIDIVREGAALSVSGVSDLAATEASEGCGYVSVLGTPPRLTKKVYPAEITRIDGTSTPLSPVNRHRLTAGRHVLVVREFIDDHVFNNTELRLRAQMKRLEDARAYKALVVDVSANTRLSIGARRIVENSSAEDFRENRYWEPVVWASEQETCR